MTAAEPQPLAAPVAAGKPRFEPRHLLAFGTGVAIEIAPNALEIAVVRVRPSGARILRRAAISHYANTAAASWFETYRDAVRGLDPAGVTVLLPRREVSVRYVPLPGVTSRGVADALSLRLRALHPFPEDDVAWCWTPAGKGALVGLVRISTLGRYEALFAEAGIPVASFTFTASVAHAAARLYREPALPFLGISETDLGVFEAYGEGGDGAIFSGEFAGAAVRAAAAGAAELRLPEGVDAIGLVQLFPHDCAEETTQIDRPLLYAAGITAACPWLLRTANFLPPERRAGQSRFWIVPTIVLTLMLALVATASFAMGAWRERSYAEALRGEIAKVQPAAARAGALDGRLVQAQQRIELLDSFRARSRSDFDVLNELTHILQPPTWTTQVELYPDYVIVAGETEQAAGLLKLLDSSPLFRNSEFVASVTRTGKNEQFRIRTFRRKL